MWSLETLRQINREACERHAEENDGMLLPAVIESLEDISPKKLRVPSLCEACDDVELELLDTVMVDHSGWGAEYEPADTMDQFMDRLRRMFTEHGPLAVGVLEQGQFQIHVQIWKCPERADV